MVKIFKKSKTEQKKTNKRTRKGQSMLGGKADAE